MKLAEFKSYIGDASLKYGGLFINLDNFKHGYADCLRVTDLDSGAGIDSTVLAERISVCFDDGKKVKQAYECCGTDKPYGNDVHSKKLSIVDMCASYGTYDTVQDMMGPHAWVIVESDSWATQDELETWKGEVVRLTEDQDVFKYLYDEGFLSEFE